MSNVSMKGVVFASKSPCKSPIGQTTNSSSRLNEKTSNDFIFSASKTINLQNAIYPVNPSTKISNQVLDTNTSGQQQYNPLKHPLTPTRTNRRITDNSNNSISYVKNILSRSRSPYAAAGQSSSAMKNTSFIECQNNPNQVIVSNNNLQQTRNISNNNPLSPNKQISQNQSYSYFGTPQMQKQQSYFQAVRNGQNNPRINDNDNNNLNNQNSNIRYNNQDFRDSTNTYDLSYPSDRRNQTSNDLNFTRNKTRNNLSHANHVKEQSIYNMILTDLGKNPEIITKGSSKHKGFMDRSQSGGIPENDNDKNNNNQNNMINTHSNPISRTVSDHLRIMQQQQSRMVQHNQQDIYLEQKYQYQQQQEQLLSNNQEQKKKQDFQKQSLGILSLSNRNLDQCSNPQHDIKQTNCTRRKSGSSSNISIQKTASSTCQNCLKLDSEIEKLLEIINQCQKCSLIVGSNPCRSSQTFRVFNQVPLNQSQQLNQQISSTAKESRELLEYVTHLKRQLDAVRQERDLELSKNEEFEQRFEVQDQELTQTKRLNANINQKLKEYQEFMKTSFGKINLVISKECSQEADYLKQFVTTVIDYDKGLRSSLLKGTNKDLHESSREIQRLQDTKSQNEQLSSSLVIPSAIKALDMVYRLKTADLSENPFITRASPPT